MAKMEVGVEAAAEAAYTAKRKEEKAAAEAAAEIQRMKRGYLIKVCCHGLLFEILDTLCLLSNALSQALAICLEDKKECGVV